ncbi:Basement Membrane-Specific Heparan Sulfate Proteoglycan Core Protein [Manis pentadactyla]|nr:Basement Membrane-Specific Heparan Sulfate Proteoglycan Core Protein [Manis pentadactyla]
MIESLAEGQKRLQPYESHRLQVDSGDVLLMMKGPAGMDLSGILKMTLVICLRCQEGAFSRMDLPKHCQDDSGDVLLMIRSGKGLAAVDLSGSQDDSGDLFSPIVISSRPVFLVPFRPVMGQKTLAALNLPGIVKLPGDVLLMMKALAAVWISQHRQDDSGDVLLMIAMIESLAEVRKALAPVWISQLCQDDSGDVLLMMSGRRLQPYGSLKHRQDDSGDVLLMMSGRRLQPYGSLKHCQDDSGDVLLMM